GRQPRADVSVLLKAANDPHSKGRVPALHALAIRGPDARPVVTTLVKALPDLNIWVKDAAVSTLIRIGPAARHALPDIVGLLRMTRDDYSRRNLMWIIARI